MTYGVMREYCVRYGESDLHFLSRLCEEEGIYYYFEQSESRHCLCFSDMPGGPPISGESDIRFSPGSGQPADTAVVSRLMLCSRSVSGQATLRDWNFLPRVAVWEQNVQPGDSAKAPGAPGIGCETYRYPVFCTSAKEVRRYASIQLARQLSLQTSIEAQSDVARFLPGHTFALHGHDREDINAKWWVVSVSCRGEQPQVLGREAPDRGMAYAAGLTAIPETTRFVPEVVHPKRLVAGDQTAIVTGPAGEEIHTDAHGRVKVQFFWDREGKRDEHTSCWLRVAQGWAGAGFGTLSIPRIGQEVIVSFLEGDPDQPLIVGRVYNAKAMPPYELPRHKTRSVLRSMSTPGAEGPRGFNELRIEDKAGAEEIYLHAEKDVEAHIKNDWREHVLRDKNRTVDGLTRVHTLKETHEKLIGPRKTELHANDNLVVHAASHTAVKNCWLRRIGAETHLYAGENAVFEAKETATLKGGGSWINLDASGVAVGGARIMLGGGATGTARKAPAPQLPEVPPTYEDDFTIQWGERPKDLSPIERLLLCLPDIAAAEAERQDRKEDKQGWLYLREMFLRWFSSRTDTGVQPYGEEPFWVDWDWVMAYPYAHAFYKVFTNSLYEATPHILNAAARQKLGDILKREGYLRDERTNFDFTSAPWEDWERLYHTLTSVSRWPGMDNIAKLYVDLKRRTSPLFNQLYTLIVPPESLQLEVDGLMAVLAGFTLRALAAGHTEPLGGGRWRITVTKVSVFAHDKFNFADDAGFGNYLGYWSCEKGIGAQLFPPSSGGGNFIWLENEDFRAFREKRKHGVDFLVLSEAHPVTPFSERSYEYPCGYLYVPFGMAQ